MSPQREVDDLKARLIQARAETTAAETALAIERRMSQLATDARIVELQHASALKERQLTAQVEKLSLEVEKGDERGRKLVSENEELKKLVLSISSSADWNLRCEALRLTGDGADMLTQLQLHLRTEGFGDSHPHVNLKSIYE